MAERIFLYILHDGMDLITAIVMKVIFRIAFDSV